MRARMIFVCSSLAACLIGPPVAAQGLPYEVQLRCPFQNNFQDPLQSQDCDNEPSSLAVSVAPPEHEKKPWKEHPYKFKKKIVHWKWFDHGGKWFDHTGKPEQRAKGYSASNPSKGSSGSKQGVGKATTASGRSSGSQGGGIGESVSRAGSTVGGAVGNVLR